MRQVAWYLGVLFLSGPWVAASECYRVVLEGKGIRENSKVLLRVAEGSDSESDYELEGFVESRHRKWLGVNLRVELVYREPCLLGCKAERFRLVQLLDPSVRPKSQMDALGSRMPMACPSRSPSRK